MSMLAGIVAVLNEAVLILVSVSDTSVDNLETSGTVYANYKIDADGSIYKSASNGGYGSAFETWLVNGLNSDVWVERTINLGTLSTDDIAGSRVQCNSDLEIGVTRSIVGEKAAQVQLDFYDAETGGNLLDSATIDLAATRDSGA